MKSVFFRRLLIALCIAMLLASAFMLGGYVILSRDIFSGMELEQLQLKVEAIKELVRQHEGGGVSDAAFVNLYGSLTKAENLTAFNIDKNGGIAYMQNMLGIPDDALVQGLRDHITKLLSGEDISLDNVDIAGYGEVLVAGVPLIGNSGAVTGAVVFVQSSREIIEASGRMTTLLLWIAIIVVPVIMLAVSWRVRRMTEPLHNMSEAAIEMSKGNFEIRVDDGEMIGEAGVLARALNNLCETLSNTIYQLRLEKVQLDEILQSLTDGVAVTDKLGMLTHYNSALMRMFGAVNVEKREELVNDELVWRAFDEVFISGEPETITCPMAGERTLWITMSPVVTEEGERTGVVGLFKDMTEMERLEATRREYVANVSHELRTPLTAMQGLLEPLADGMVKSEADRQRYYKIMLHEAARLSRLISDMMMISRLQSGAEYMEVSRVDINELINDVAGGYSAAAGQKGIELIVDAGIRLPDAVTDPDRIEQVLIILLDNAMRYTPEGGSITIRARDGQKLLISVIDTGCGIPEADQPHVFERFYKVDKSRGTTGTGLGLSIAKYIIDKLDESITLESTEGMGTCFTFTLKKYVSNAIALGPAVEDRYNRDIPPSGDGTAAENKDGQNIVDAAYEVIPGDEHAGKPFIRRKTGK